MKNTPDVADFIRAYDEWAKSEELCGGGLFDEMLRQRDILDVVFNVQEKGDQFRDELAKVTRQRDAMIKRCHEQIAFAKTHATVDQGWMLEREYQGMIDACEEVLAANEAAKEEK